MAVTVTPTHQTLILASERRGPGNTPATTLGKSSTTGGSVLQRLTIVAAQPDDTLLYVSADYAQALGGSAAQPSTDVGRTYTAPNNSSSRSTAVVAVLPTSGSSRDSYGNWVSSNRGSTPTSYLKPVEQYARTQRILADVPRVQQIDVYA